MNRGEIKTEILVRSGKDTTSAWTSEAFLNDWINQSHKWAAGYKPWPFTEGKIETTYTTASETVDFEGYKADSFRLVQIGGKRLDKLNFEDYQTYKEDNSSGTDRVFSDFGKSLYINTLTGLTGSLTGWGQYMPADIPDGDGSAADDLDTVFSQGGDEGNQAIIERTLGYISYRDGKKDDAVNHYKVAKDLLDELWKRIQDEQFAYQTKDRDIFKRIDVLGGALRDDTIKRDQFN